MENSTEALICEIRAKAENLYNSHRFLCSEAIIVALNGALDGGLTEEQAVGIAAGLPVGIGNSGCTCGALSGGVLSLGLFLGRDTSGKVRKEVREASGLLHQEFKEVFHSTCCRVLTRQVKDKPDEHFRQCARLTGCGAEMAARLILERRPEFTRTVNHRFLSRRISRIGAFLRNLSGMFR